ncbi:MAG: outer membrane beta-barrel protein [Capnocytophaga sp.]|nr:outer membrane beta-barrel protein [Capnocytophaga sp.]
MKFFFLCIGFWITFGVASQSLSDTSPEVDLKYREDQFYFGIAYNWLISKPSGVSQYSFSRNIFGGFVRDIPLNKDRNMGIGVGFGYNYNLLYTSLLARKTSDGISYEAGSISRDRIDTNYFSNHQIEFIPIELRWRTSTPYTTKFWRIYTGMKLSYSFSSYYKLEKENENASFSVPDLKNYLDYKVYLALGNNTWNIFMQYSFVPLFKGKKLLNGDKADAYNVNIGLIFYIL